MMIGKKIPSILPTPRHFGPITSYYFICSCPVARRSLLHLRSLKMLMFEFLSGTERLVFRECYVFDVNLSYASGRSVQLHDLSPNEKLPNVGDSNSAVILGPS